MDFVSDEQRKAVMASLRERGQLRWRPTKSYSWSWPQSEYRWDQNDTEEIKKNLSVTKSKKQSSKLPKKKKVKCFYCHKLFDKELARDQHIRDVHPKNGKADNKHSLNFICSNCGKIFTNRKEFEEHVALSKLR